MGTKIYEEARTKRRRDERDLLRSLFQNKCKKCFKGRSTYNVMRTAPAGSNHRRKRVAVSTLEGHHIVPYSESDPFRYIGWMKRPVPPQYKRAIKDQSGFPATKFQLLCKGCHDAIHDKDC